MQLKTDLIYRPNPFISLKNTPNLIFLAQNKKYEDSTLIYVFQYLLQIELNQLKNLVLNNPISYILNKNKEKSKS